MALLRGAAFGMLIALQFAVHAGCFLVPSLSSPCTSQRKNPLTSVLRMRYNEFSIPMVGIVSAGLLLAGSPARPAFAERSGFEIFTQKCSSCHKSGGNTVVGASQWTLQKDALQKYEFNDVDKIIDLLTKGKKIEADGRLMSDPGHPAYGGKTSKKKGLLPAEIETISYYVLEQAEAGWPGREAAAAEGAE